MFPLAVPSSGICAFSTAGMQASAPAPLVRPISPVMPRSISVATFCAVRLRTPPSSSVTSSKRVPLVFDAAAKAAAMPSRTSRP
jgi:hypothetical protein